jgi:hypothetical protein
MSSSYRCSSFFDRYFDLIVGITFILVIGSVFGFAFWSTKAKCQRTRETRRETRAEGKEIVSQWATRLEQQTTPCGGYARFNQQDSGEIPCLDPWKSNLRYTYFADAMAEYVQVRSLGPDRQLETGDDIIDTRQVDIIHISE